jgi:hypothetical protein
MAGTLTRFTARAAARCPKKRRLTHSYLGQLAARDSFLTTALRYDIFVVELRQTLSTARKLKTPFDSPGVNCIFYIFTTCNVFLRCALGGYYEAGCEAPL